MASKIPGFTSGLKPPSTSSLTSVAKRRVPDMSSTQPIEKRPRTTDDAQSELIVTQMYCAFLFPFFFTVGPTAGKLVRSKSVSSLAIQNAKPTVPLSKASSGVLRTQPSTVLNRPGKSFHF